MDSRMRRATFALLALPSMLGITAEAYGQRSTTRPAASAKARRTSPNERTKGLMLGAHVVAAPGLTIGGGVFEVPYSTSLGPGAGLRLGYGFNRTFSSYVSFDVARQGATKGEGITGSWGLGHLEIGARANLVLDLPNSVPYVSASFGRRGLGVRAVDDEGDQADFRMEGRTLGLGVGIEHFFSPTVSFDAGVQLAFGKFDHITVAGRERTLPMDGTMSSRLRVGLNWRPCLTATCARPRR